MGAAPTLAHQLRPGALTRNAKAQTAAFSVLTHRAFLGAKTHEFGLMLIVAMSQHVDKRILNQSLIFVNTCPNQPQTPLHRRSAACAGDRRRVVARPDEHPVQSTAVL